MNESSASQSAFAIAYEYTLRYYPRWFTWVQLNLPTANQAPGSSSPGSIVNRLAGPLGMGPEYKIVVAINDDTVYAQAFLDVSAEPVILTLPSYRFIYSVLQLDVFGTVLSTPLTDNPPPGGGTYAFVAPGWSGTLPEGAVTVEMPVTSSELILRVDKWSPDGIDLTKLASEFRKNMILQPLSKYDPSCTSMECGRTFIAPLFNYAASAKLMADEGIAFAPEAFLRTLQAAMASDTTAPLDDGDHALIAAFNERFDAAQTMSARDSLPLSEILRGAQAAHAALINRWQSNRGSTNWIHFNNIGDWGKNYLDRAALTEYIQFGNNAPAAYYANAFVDGSGVPLDGSQFGYTLTFTKDQLPQYKRFWSLTAYTPLAIELVPNPLDKYLVASYTPGLVYDLDGSVTIYIAAEHPENAPIANWLPVPKSSFSMLFRVYGPKGTAQSGEYVVPAIHRVPIR